MEKLHLDCLCGTLHTPVLPGRRRTVELSQSLRSALLLELGCLVDSFCSSRTRPYVLALEPSLLEEF